jgi:hypothetical protein
MKYILLYYVLIINGLPLFYIVFCVIYILLLQAFFSTSHKSKDNATYMDVFLLWFTSK